MRKMIFGLCAVMMCLITLSCSKSESKDSDDEGYIEKLSSIAKDIEKNGDEWSLDEWIDVMKEAAENELAFWESNPTEKEVDEYDDACEELQDAFRDLREKSRTKAYKAMEKKEVKKIIEKSQKAENKVRKKNNKKGKNRIEAVEDLIDQIKYINTADDLVVLLKKVAEAQIAFYESNPDQRDVDAFEKSADALTKALEEKSKNDKDFEKTVTEAGMKLLSDKELMELMEKAEKAAKDFEAKNGGEKK